MEKQVTIYSYQKVFKWEKKIYTIGNVNLPAPVNPYDLLAFATLAGLMFLLSALIPLLNQIHGMVRYILFPGMATAFFRKKKLDGKNPVKYFAGCVRYLLTIKGTFRQLFQKYPEKSQKLSLHWDCSMGHD